MSYLSFVDKGTSLSGKTKIWKVVNINDPHSPLGYISWYGPWRKYLFMPEPGTKFDWTCMRELSDFSESKTKEHYS